MTRIFAYGTQSHKTLATYLWLFLLLTLGVALEATAAESAGRLLFARGEVQITSTDAQPRAASRGDLLYIGDTIITGSAANAQLRMSDGAMIALKADTVFRIEDQQYNPKKPGEGSQVGELLRGGMRAVTGAIGHEKPSAVSFRTPVATIGIRGTVFDTIYVPPEGLPGLPGVAPGTYTLVLEGQVLLSSGGGELLLGVGEIGYVPFEGAPPELRPDLEALFVQYASYVEQLLQKGGRGVPGYVRTAFSSFDSDEVFTLFADYVSEQFLPPPPSGTPNATVTPGPFGIANVYSTGGQTPAAYQGDFFSSPVTVGSTYGDLQSATGGTGGIAGYQFPVAFQPTPIQGSVGSTTAGNSTINWGQFDGLSIQLTDQNNLRIPVGSTDFINYINATNVIVSVADLPTLGSYTYNYVGGSGTPLLTGSNLNVDFGTAQMDVTLIADVFGTAVSYTANNQDISTFYGNGITLNATVTGLPVTGSVSGRFVGSQAEGAIAGFLLDAGDGFLAGTAAFAR